MYASDARADTIYELCGITRPILAYRHHKAFGPLSPTLVIHALDGITRTAQEDFNQETEILYTERGGTAKTKRR